MGRQNTGARKRPDASGRTSTPAPDVSSSFLADVFLRCLRAIVRARDAADLVQRICHALVVPGAYAEAFVRIEDQSEHPARVRSWYCGANTAFVENPDRFLTEASLAPSIRAAMDAPAHSVRAITSDAAAVVLHCGESCVGVLFVCTGGRALGKDEIEAVECACRRHFRLCRPAA